SVAGQDEADHSALHNQRQRHTQIDLLNLFHDRIDLLAAGTRFHDDDHAIAPDENAHSDISLYMVISPKKQTPLTPDKGREVSSTPEIAALRNFRGPRSRLPRCHPASRPTPRL